MHIKPHVRFRHAAQLLLVATVLLVGGCRGSAPTAHVGAFSGPQSSWLALNWYVDPQNMTGCASDANSGQSATCGPGVGPFVTKAQIAQRWGTWSPILNAINVLITYLSSDVTANDPGLFTPDLVNGATLTHFAPLPTPSFTGTLLAVTAKSRTGNQALASTFTTTTGVIAANMLLVNTTRSNSRAHVSRLVAGVTWQISQPQLPYAGGQAGPANTEVDTWANGDAIVGYVLTSVNLAVMGGRAIDNNPAFGPSHIVWQLNVSDPAALFDLLEVSGLCAPLFVEGVSTRTLNFRGNTEPVLGSFSNWNSQAAQSFALSSGISYAAGVLGGGIALIADRLILTNDVIIGPGIGTTLTECSVASPGLYTESRLVFEGDTLLGVGSIIYGSGTVWSRVGCVRYSATTAVATFPTSGGISCSAGAGAGLAYSNVTVAGVTTVHQLALTPTALDAAAGAAGFGGLAYVPGVSAFQNNGAAP